MHGQHIRPCKYLQAIREYPTPCNITDLRSWFSLVNLMLLAWQNGCSHSGNAFTWNDDLDNLFAESKVVIADENEKGVRIFEKAKRTCLATYWSKHGIGFWMFQKHCTCPGANPHQIWVRIMKGNEKIVSSYCTCFAGYASTYFIITSCYI